MAAVRPAGPPPMIRQSRMGSSIRCPMDCRTAGSRLARAHELDLLADRLRARRVHGLGAGVAAGYNPAGVERTQAADNRGIDAAGHHCGRDLGRNADHQNGEPWRERAYGRPRHRRAADDRRRLHPPGMGWRIDRGNADWPETRPMTFRASVLTLYPDMFPGPLGASLAGRALQDGVWSLETRNIRDSATDKHRSVDDTPAGGGAGMVLRPDV